MKFTVWIVPPARPSVSLPRKPTGIAKKCAEGDLYKLAMPAKAEETFADLWKRAEDRFERDYRQRDGMGGTYFSKMQDLQGGDIFMTDKIGDMYDQSLSHAELQIKIRLEWVDREASVMPGSELRPSGFQKRHLSDLDEQEHEAFKRLRLEDLSAQERELDPIEDGPDRVDEYELQEEDEEDMLNALERHSRSVERVQTTDRDELPSSSLGNRQESIRLNAFDRLASQSSHASNTTKSPREFWTKEEDDIISAGLHRGLQVPTIKQALLSPTYNRSICAVRSRIKKLRREGLLSRNKNSVAQSPMTPESSNTPTLDLVSSSLRRPATHSPAVIVSKAEQLSAQHPRSSLPPPARPATGHTVVRPFTSDGSSPTNRPRRELATAFATKSYLLESLRESSSESSDESEISESITQDATPVPPAAEESRRASHESRVDEREGMLPEDVQILHHENQSGDQESDDDGDVPMEDKGQGSDHEDRLDDRKLAPSEGPQGMTHVSQPKIRELVPLEDAKQDRFNLFKGRTDEQRWKEAQFRARRHADPDRTEEFFTESVLDDATTNAFLNKDFAEVERINGIRSQTVPKQTSDVPEMGSPGHRTDRTSTPDRQASSGPSDDKVTKVDTTPAYATDTIVPDEDPPAAPSLDSAQPDGRKSQSKLKKKKKRKKVRIHIPSVPRIRPMKPIKKKTTVRPFGSDSEAGC